VPLCPAHDTAFHAAYIARILSEAGEYADSYSYWTFSDVFEEMDVPRSVFHGGFGLVALGSIKKPTFYAFAFFAQAGAELLYRDENLLVTRDRDRYAIIGWNWRDPRDPQPAEDPEYTLCLPSLGPDALLVKRDVGGTSANPLRTWSNMGKPRTPNRAQRQLLQTSAEPLQTDERLREKDGAYRVELTIPGNHLCMLEITSVTDFTGSYQGYDKEEFYGLEE
jgi:xylan 1,4-beta-xylosidase